MCRGLWVGVDVGVVGGGPGAGSKVGVVPPSSAKTQSRSKRPLRYRLFKLSYISHYSKPKVMFLGCLFSVYIQTIHSSS